MRKIFSIIVKLFIITSFFVYLLILKSVTIRTYGGWKTVPLSVYWKGNVNLVPFKTINNYLRVYSDKSINATIPIQNLVGNIILLAPMAIYLPVFFKKMRSFKWDMLVVFIIDVMIEMNQLIFRMGSADIDDIILNMAGAVFGYLTWKYMLNKILKFR